MRILSCPETSKGEFHLQKHVEASYQVTVEQWYFQIPIPRLYSKKSWRGPSALNLWNPGHPAYAFSEKKTKIFELPGRKS